MNEVVIRPIAGQLHGDARRLRAAANAHLVFIFLTVLAGLGLIVALPARLTWADDVLRRQAEPPEMITGESVLNAMLVGPDGAVIAVGGSIGTGRPLILTRARGDTTWQRTRITGLPAPALPLQIRPGAVAARADGSLIVVGAWSLPLPELAAALSRARVDFGRGGEQSPATEDLPAPPT